MSIVQWELFRMVQALNHDIDGIHELPFARELNGRKATIESLQHIVTKGKFKYHALFMLSGSTRSFRIVSRNLETLTEFDPLCGTATKEPARQFLPQNRKRF